MAGFTMSPTSTNRIRSNLLKIHALRLEGATVAACLQKAYDAYAAELVPEAGAAAEELLKSLIPGWLFRDAVEFGWVRYPPLQSEIRVSMGGYMPGVRNRRVIVPADDSQLTEVLGDYRVTRSSKTWFERILAGRVAHWRGEVMVSWTSGESSRQPHPVLRKKAHPPDAEEDTLRLHEGGEAGTQIDGTNSMNDARGSSVPDQAVGRSRKGDGKLLEGSRLVTFRVAEMYLGISERQRQNLIASGSLVVEGEGHNRKITVASLRKYLPPEIPK